MIANIAHACFIVRDLEQSLAFYRDALGMEIAFEFRNDEGRRTGLYLHAGARNFIELFERDHGQPEGASYQHLSLEVEDLAATVTALREKGIETTEPRIGNDNSHQAWLADPDGNRIELHAYTPESKQQKFLRDKQEGR